MLHRSLCILLLSLCLAACAYRTPVKPGEIPTQEDVDPSDEAYGERVLFELSKTYPISNSERLNRRVRSVVARLADAAGAGTQPWHVYVLQDDNMLNAAATRGNYVFVWTGLLKLISSDDELAAVLGHEIGHVLANHTMPTPTEQVNSVLVETAGIAANTALGTESMGFGGQVASMLAQALLVNPESQRLELEADHIGLFMMAKANYDPEASVSLWKKMSERTGTGSGALAFLSTHPPNEDRIVQLEQLIPEARRASGSSEPSKRDTFNRNQVPPTRAAKPDTFNLRPDSYQPGPGIERWKVVEDWTEVYTRPDTGSRVKNRLFWGTEVAVRNTRGGWLEIEHPERGFVQGRDLSPAR